MENKENKEGAGNKNFNLLQYLITTMVTVIGIFTTIIFFMLNDIKTEQTEFAKELLRIKTVQDINTGSISNLSARVSTLELNYLDYIKNWVDQNYVRKPQD